MSQDRTPSLPLSMLFAAMAGGMGWGIRGQYGHGTGAMIAGALVGLLLILIFARQASSLSGARAAALFALGICLGGSMTYGQTLGLTHDAELVGNWQALGWGLLGLFLKGGIWIGLAAAFLGIGLGGVNALRAAGEDVHGVRDAVDFIAELRQQPDKAKLPIGRDVVVIGGGMTAVDAAVQSRLLGAQNVTIVYRRGQEKMSASVHEQDHAQQVGVRIICNAAPVEVIAAGGTVSAVEFAYTEDAPEGLKLLEDRFTLKADQVFKAIGQTLVAPEGMGGPKLATQPMARVWAGGDCAAGGEDLTVTAVAEGRDAAEAIHADLMGAVG